MNGSTIIHHETLTWKFAYFLIALFFLLALFMLIMPEKFDYNHVQNSSLFMQYIVSGTMFLVSLALLNFVKLSIVIDQDDGVTASYGLFHKTVPWHVITGAHRDTVSFWRYGGWGIRVARINGRSRTVYNIMGAEDCVVVESVEGAGRVLAFSTNHPDEVIEIINKYAAAGDSA